jgi:hypothetical protein
VCHRDVKIALYDPRLPDLTTDRLLGWEGELSYMEDDVTLISTFHEINEHNRRFWEKENALRDRRIADEITRETAFARLAREQARGTPVYYQTTVEQSLADAEGDKQLLLSLQGRKGGQAKKSDALQLEILNLARRDPDITVAELKDKLTKERFPGLIDEVEDGTIWFVQPDGSGRNRSKEAPISGLKDRLSRAKRRSSL